MLLPNLHHETRFSPETSAYPTAISAFVGGDRRVNHQDPGFFGLEHADYFQV
jgi:hypothetical protein